MKKGTAIATVAKPVAKTIDYFLGTNLENCGGCRTMEHNLNNGMSISEALYYRFILDQQEQQKKEN